MSDTLSSITLTIKRHGHPDRLDELGTFDPVMPESQVFGFDRAFVYTRSGQPLYVTDGWIGFVAARDGDQIVTAINVAIGDQQATIQFDEEGLEQFERVVTNHRAIVRSEREGMEGEKDQ